MCAAVRAGERARTALARANLERATHFQIVLGLAKALRRGQHELRQRRCGSSAWNVL
jgi:hypothetical protein